MLFKEMSSLKQVILIVTCQFVSDVVIYFNQITLFANKNMTWFDYIIKTSGALNYVSHMLDLT